MTPMSKQVVAMKWYILIVLAVVQEYGCVFTRQGVVCKGKPYNKSPYIPEECGNYYVSRKPPTMGETLRLFYPGYLMTTPETNSLVRCTISGSKNVTTFPQKQGKGKRSPTSDEILSPTYYHVCCGSVSKYIYPTSIGDLDGNTVEVVQIPELYQPVYTETCEQTPGCECCTCSQPHDFIYRVIIYLQRSPDVFDIGFIRVPGSCKCLNISPPGCS